MDVLSSRLILHPNDLARTQTFYRDTLGLAVYRKFGDPAAPGLVFFAGSALLEVSGAGSGDGSNGRGPDVALWLQVRDVEAEHRRLRDAGVPIARPPRAEPWGLIEMWINDPDGVAIVLVEIPDNHPLRRDNR